MKTLRAIAAPFTAAFDTWTATDVLRCACRAATDGRHRRPVPVDSPSLAP